MPSVVGGHDLTAEFGVAAHPEPVEIEISEGEDTVVVGWGQYAYEEISSIVSASLGGAPPDAIVEILDPHEDACATGFIVWFGRSAGIYELDIEWSVPGSGYENMYESRAVCVAFVSGANAVRDSEAIPDGPEDSTPKSVTLGTAPGDLVLKMDFADNDTPPGLSAGWSTVDTGGGDSCYRMSYITASGASTVCDAENEVWTSLAAVALYGAAPSGGNLPAIRRHYQRMKAA